MKKTLILSITMTVILIISSLTAVFSWYISNNTVTARNATITASSAYEPLRLSINNSSYGRTINLSSLFGNEMTKPTAPKAKVTSTDARFVHAEINDKTLLAEVSNQNFIIKNVKFYLKNITDSAVAVTVNAHLDGELASKLAWVMIIDGVNYAILTNGYNTVTVTDGIVTTGTPIPASSMDITVAPNDVVTCTLMLWVDGVTVVDDDQVKDAYINFNFDPAES